MFLAGMLGSSWFAVLAALQNAGYVLTTRGTAPPGSAALDPKTSGVTSGTPRKRGGALGGASRWWATTTARAAAASIEATDGTSTSGRP